MLVTSSERMGKKEKQRSGATQPGSAERPEHSSEQSMTGSNCNEHCAHLLWLRLWRVRLSLSLVF